MTETEHLMKFRDCAARLLDPERIEAALGAIARLAHSGDAATLVAQLVPAA